MPAMPGVCRAAGRRSPVKQASNARNLLDGGDSEDAEAGESASLLRGQGLDSVFSHFEGQQQQAQQVRCCHGAAEGRSTCTCCGGASRQDVWLVALCSWYLWLVTSAPPTSVLLTLVLGCREPGRSPVDFRCGLRVKMETPAVEGGLGSAELNVAYMMYPPAPDPSEMHAEHSRF